MRRATRVAARLDGVVEARRLAASLGAVVREARERQRFTQAQLGRRVGLSQARISAVERGLGVGLPLEIWIALGIALRRPLSVGPSRPIEADAALADAGHLDIQEYLLEIGRRNGRRGSFELATNRADPSHSIDICEEDPARGSLLVLEAWNWFGDLGAAARSSDRKVAEATQTARSRYVTAGSSGIRPRIRNIVPRYPRSWLRGSPGHRRDGWRPSSGVKPAARSRHRLVPPLAASPATDALCPARYGEATGGATIVTSWPNFEKS